MLNSQTIALHKKQTGLNADIPLCLSFDLTVKKLSSMGMNCEIKSVRKLVQSFHESVLSSGLRFVLELNCVTKLPYISVIAPSEVLHEFKSQ